MQPVEVIYVKTHTTYGDQPALMGPSVKPDVIQHIIRGKLIPVEGHNINIKQQHHVTPHSDTGKRSLTQLFAV